MPFGTVPFFACVVRTRTCTCMFMRSVDTKMMFFFLHQISVADCRSPIRKWKQKKQHGNPLSGMMMSYHHCYLCEITKFCLSVNGEQLKNLPEAFDIRILNLIVTKECLLERANIRSKEIQVPRMPALWPIQMMKAFKSRQVLGILGQKTVMGL